jgi:hypothetical protein
MDSDDNNALIVGAPQGILEPGRPQRCNEKCTVKLTTSMSIKFITTVIMAKKSFITFSTFFSFFPWCQHWLVLDPQM